MLLGIGCIVLSNIFAVWMPKVVRDSVNDIIDIAKTNIDTITTTQIIQLALSAIGFYVLFSLLKGVFLYFTRQTIIKMSRHIEYDLKNEIYEQYQRLSFNFYKSNSTGDLMNRISEDVSKVRMYLGPGLMYTINLSILFTMIIYNMVSTNGVLTLYVLTPLPVMSVLIYFVSSKINKKSVILQKQQSLLSSLAQESFAGIRIIKAHNNEEINQKQFDKESNEYKDRSISLTKTNALFMPTVILLIGISTIFTIYFGIRYYQNGIINAGEIVEFVIYVNMLTWPFASVGWVISVIQRAAASQERINEFLAEEVEIENPTSTPFSFKNSIEFKDVGLTYTNSGTTAINHLNLKIEKGQSVGIIGRTGSGKSSLAYLLLRLIDPTSGQILVDQTALNEINLNDWRDTIGYVPQEHFLFSDTIKNNILFGLKDENVSDDVLFKATKAAGIHESILNFPNGYETLLGERGINLSGGQKQRLSIARALIKNPDILILDDCLSAVDNETEEQILHAINEDLKNKTSFIISHRISSIKYADKIIVIKDGLVAEEGSHEDLLALNGIYTDFFNKQKLEEEQ